MRVSWARCSVSAAGALGVMEGGMLGLFRILGMGTDADAAAYQMVGRVSDIVLILLGAFRGDPRMAAFAATGVILSATYMLWMFQRVNYGPVANDKNAALPDLRPREWVIIVPIIAVLAAMRLDLALDGADGAGVGVLLGREPRFHGVERRDVGHVKRFSHLCLTSIG